MNSQTEHGNRLRSLHTQIFLAYAWTGVQGCGFAGPGDLAFFDNEMPIGKIG